jgi:hypothetical protein
VTLNNDRRLFEVGEQPRCVDSVFLRLALEGFGFGWFQREAPVKVDASEPCRLFEKSETVTGKCFCNGISVVRLPGKVESRHHPHVLVEAGTFRQPTQRAFNRAHTRFKLLVGQSFFIDAS